MVKCTKCKRKIEGEPAYKECKPYCSLCFELVKKSKSRGSFNLWYKKLMLIQNGKLNNRR